MTNPNIEQLFLVPGRTKAEVAIWGAAVVEYAATFPGVYISHDYTDAARPEYEQITIIEPDYWPDLLWTLIKQNPRQPRVETLVAPFPEVLAQILHARVFYGLRFGFQTETEWQQQWGTGNCLIGLHGRADGEMFAPDFNVVREARIEAVKITSHATPATIEALRAINRDMFIMVRPLVSFFDNNAPRRITPDEFVQWTSSDLQRLFDYDPSIQYVEVHNEPNINIEGMWGSWSNGREFATWFESVVRLYRQRWPNKKYGYPGLSPGGDMSGIRLGDRQFIAESAAAAARADWIGVHGYWQDEAEMTDIHGGFTWRYYRKIFPDQVLFITEFGNAWQPRAVVAEQYSRYYGMLRHTTGIGGAFSYIVSTSDPIESRRWAWRDENGQDLGIAKEVGLRKHIK